MEQNETARYVDLNVDVGEGFGPYRVADDEALLDAVSSANVACGFHAGDPSIMRRTVEACLARGVAIGAHPGLPDLPGFGRRELDATASEIEDCVLYQIGALEAFVRAAGGRLAHVKPHGALYHMASRRRDLAEAVASAVRALGPGLAVVGPAGSELLLAAEAAGLRPVPEGFADRAYLADGSLAPRRLAGSVLASPDEALEQTLSLLRAGEVRALDGGTARVTARTVCLHGDTPGAAAFALALRRGLEAHGYEIRPLSTGA
ncbi:LamB/YcsF family protein [Cohnella xylanilytica]|uniref:5-oxoprolinase subunit A n=1 Tax=Cohnella xylanilytica TaxID=557555 RepID=A0A841U3Q2_9BACL|nr:5-oxoprolinase subunit PxpA [Cohnella xylanilytica]MBB6695216.1 LamB/YcsF family protein [Cohnella xylanilytica]